MKNEINVSDFRHSRRGDMSESSCRLRVFIDDDGSAVVVAEETGVGRSVTNGAEDIATKAVSTFELDFDRTRFIEFYPKSQLGMEARDGEFSEVVFESEARGFEFSKRGFSEPAIRLHSPSWKYLTREDAEKICGLPL